MLKGGHEGWLLSATRPHIPKLYFTNRYKLHKTKILKKNETASSLKSVMLILSHNRVVTEISNYKQFKLLQQLLIWVIIISGCYRCNDVTTYQADRMKIHNLEIWYRQIAFFFFWTLLSSHSEKLFVEGALKSKFKH